MRPSPYKRLKAIEQIQRIGKLPDYFNLLPFAGGIFFQREGFNPRYKITIGSAVATIEDLYPVGCGRPGASQL